MKMLYILNMANRVNNFSYTSMLAAKKLGIEFHITGNWGYKNLDEKKQDEDKYGIYIHQIDFIRNPFDYKNFKAYKQLDTLVKKEGFDVIHCNTPIGGLLGRICAKRNGVKKVIYTAHGFHFYKGAPLLNWLVYYPVEKICSYFTDVLITINHEDYELAKKKMRAADTEYIPGVGIDTKKFQLAELDRDKKRKKMGVADGDIVLLSVGELNSNKNHEVIVKAVSELHNSKIHYFIAGQGEKKLYLSDLAEKLNVNLHLLGYRTDIAELCGMSDIFCFSSYREGLSVSLMEAMAAGLPVVCSKIRGNTDLIDSDGGELFDPRSAEDCSRALQKAISRNWNKMGEYNRQKVKEFGRDRVSEKMYEIYKDALQR